MNENLSKKTESELIEMIKNEKVISLCNAICEVVRRRVKSESVVKVLSEKKNSSESFWNTYLVSDFASAAIDILEVEKYEGQREEILRLLETKLDF